MLTRVLWDPVYRRSDPRFKWRKVVYSFVSPDREEILYIGQAYDCTVRQRWSYRGNKKVWDWLSSELRTPRSSVVLLVGQVVVPVHRKLTRRVISDVESLLIYRIKPCANVHHIDTLNCRPGIRVQCLGGWHGWKRDYRCVE